MYETDCCGAPIIGVNDKVPLYLAGDKLRNVKAVDAFQRCSICPNKRKDDFCNAIRTVFPFLEMMDKYVSFDKVTAVYKENTTNLLHVTSTTMQKALKYVSLLC